MRKYNLFNKLSLILCVVLIAAMTLLTACGGNDQLSGDDGKSGTVEDNNKEPEETVNLGEGDVAFTFEVVDGTGNKSIFTINTDKKMVGDALLEHKLIVGEEGAYGIYVKTVNGITADYDKDGTYWAFYINGEYAMTGVDKTEITEGTTYSFKVEK